MGNLPSDTYQRRQVQKRLTVFAEEEKSATTDARKRYLDLLDMGVFLLACGCDPPQPLSMIIDALRVSPLQELSNRLGCVHANADVARRVFQELGANSACEKIFSPHVR